MQSPAPNTNRGHSVQRLVRAQNSGRPRKKSRDTFVIGTPRDGIDGASRNNCPALVVAQLVLLDGKVVLGVIGTLLESENTNSRRSELLGDDSSRGTQSDDDDVEFFFHELTFLMRA